MKYILLTIIMAFTFNACSSDDDTGGLIKGAKKNTDTSKDKAPIIVDVKDKNFTSNIEITSFSFTNTGGAIVSCAISPPLSTGLKFNATNCTISGTPVSLVLVQKEHTITAINAIGSGKAKVKITINPKVLEALEAPNIADITTDQNFTTATAISPIKFTNSGGAITSCVISPSLPSGLTLNTTTCEISGTPTGSADQKIYTITATNIGGSNTAIVKIVTKMVAPNIANVADKTLTATVEITPISFINSGGRIESCTIDKPLSLGLVFSTTTCIISGTPVGSGVAQKEYTITATNTAGSNTAKIKITISEAIPPKITIIGARDRIFLIGTKIAPISFTSTGGVIDNCSVTAGILPQGLSINSKTCEITGTTREAKALEEYNITATNTLANVKLKNVVKVKIVVNNNLGFLIDSAIEGIKYISGSYNGYTDKNGLFKYDGNTVTFYIGDETTGISLGSATAKTDPYNNKRKIITIFDLAGSQSENNQKVVNMGKFLQSLDSDGDVSNGITIDAKTKESIMLLNLKNTINFDKDIEAFHNDNDIYNLFNDLADHFGEHRGLLDTNDVKAHLVSVRDNVKVAKILSSSANIKKEEIKILNGVFQSSKGVVQGLEYRSGNQFGRTDSNGSFKYEEGKKIKFYIYQLELGITETKPVITPADLIPATSFNHPKPRNIIRLLKAFDSTSGATIVIDNAVREALEKYRSQIDVNLPDGKANEKLNIPKGEDEFGAQFEEFEMGKDILDEITKLRGGS